MTTDPVNAFSTPCRNLVISPVGDRSCHGSWVAGPDSPNFDLMLIYFGDDSAYDFTGAEFCYRRKGFKFQLLDWAYSEMRSVIDRYDRIWCPDDDIRSNTRNINRLFEVFEAERLELAQPAIAQGDVSYRGLQQVPRLSLRYSPFVEVMCPIMTRQAFVRVSRLFLQSQSGWGIDWVWSKWFSPDEMAIIDEVGVHHTGVLTQGDLYQKLKSRGIDPIQEFDTLVNRFGGIDRKLQRRISRGTLRMKRVLRKGERLTLWERLENGFTGLTKAS